MQAKKESLSLQELKTKEQLQKKSKSLQKAVIEFIPTYSGPQIVDQNEDIHNKTYCREWARASAGNTEKFVVAQSDLLQHDITSSSLMDVTSVSRNVLKCPDVQDTLKFISKKSAQKKDVMTKKKEDEDENM